MSRLHPSRSTVVGFLLGLVILGFLPPRTALALDDVSVRLPVEFRSWTLEEADGSERTIEQIHIPLTASFGLAEGTRLVAASAVGFATYDDGETSRTLDGPSDLELQIYHRIAAARVLVFGGVRVPTGVRDLNGDELLVSEILAQPVFAMPLREYGRGLDLNAGLAWSLPLSGATELVWGVGGKLPGAYDLAADREEFTPGAEGSTSLGLQWTETGRATARKRVSIQTSYRVYTKDQLGGEDIYQEGGQLEAKARAELPSGRVMTQLRALAVVKSANTSYGQGASSVRSVELDSGTGLYGGLDLRYAVSPVVRVGLTADARKLSGNEFVERNGSAFGAGPTLGFAIPGGGWLRLRGEMLMGTAGEGDTKRDLRGFGGGASLVWRVR